MDITYIASVVASILACSIFLYLGSKWVKLKDTSLLTALKVSFFQAGIMLILSKIPLMKIFGFLILIYLIKYFYKVEIKDAIKLWLIIFAITLTIIFLVTTIIFFLYKSNIISSEIIHR